MKYTKKAVKLHGGKDLFVLTPKQTNPYITATESGNDYFIFSNGIGYTWLEAIFLSACVLQENEIIHIPLKFEYMDEYLDSYLDSESHYSSMIFMNYTTSQFKAKDVITAIKAEAYNEETIERTHGLSEDWVDNWKTATRLTVKPHGRHLIFSANRDVFEMMALSCQRLAGYENFESYNMHQPHYHHDWSENTSKSVGITLYFWTPPKKRKPMSERAFVHQFRRGIGSAIVELMNNPDNEHKSKYRDIVLRCCLKDISYDTQVEGTKSHYLYSAIYALRGMDEFINVIAAAYMKRLPSRLSQQLTDLIQAFAWDNSEKAVDTLESKYNQSKEILSKRKNFNYRYCEREQFEYLMITQMQRGNWYDFKRIIEDAGEIILSRSDNRCSEYGWFMLCAEEKYGNERIRMFFEEASLTSNSVRAFANSNAPEDQSGAGHQEGRKNEKPTFAGLMERLYPIVDNGGFYKDIGYYFKFGREASPEELIQLAKYIDTEPDFDAKAKLLKAFQRTIYPADITPLLQYATSENDMLRAAAIGVLEQIKDIRIHDLAIRFLESGDSKSALPLFKENWEKDDDALIKEAVLKSKRVTHSMQMDLRDIYEKHKSASCGDILLHAYRNGECSFCRCDIVKAMGKNNVLTDDILQECRYDSYEDTRKYAEKIIARRKN